ncbi:MAG: tyrosine-type recombinase/integrase [Gemmatimonadaceae bacterium]
MSNRKEKAPNGSGCLFRRRRVRVNERGEREVREAPQWWMRYYDVHGRRRTEATHTTSKAEATRLLRDRTSKKDRGEEIGEAHRLRFGDLATMILDDYRAQRKKSWRRLENALARLSEFFGGEAKRADANDRQSRVVSYAGGDRVLRITPDRWESYRAQRQDVGAAPATIEIERAALKHAFKLAVDSGKLPKVPFLKSSGKLKNARTGFFEADDFEAVVNELPEYWRAPLRFGYYTGWRVRSEVLPLTWAQVDFTHGVVRLEVNTTKNGDGRTFPFAALPALKALMDEQRARTTELEKATDSIIPWVFHRGGESVRGYKRAWATACDRAAHAGKPRSEKARAVVRPQLVGRIVHDLRRTAVRNLVRAGVSEHIAMQLSGHKTRCVFDRYDIVNEDDLRDGVSKLAKLGASASKDRGVLPFPPQRSAQS